MESTFWEEVDRNRRLTGPQRLSASLQLFDEAARRMLAGIKAQFPGISDAEARRIRAERLAVIRRVESLP